MPAFVFQFFFFSISGWIGETIMESVVRRRFVNKGALKGAWVPVHGIGGLAVVFFALPFKNNPALVFALCTALCTALEYIAALFLEKIFNVKGWDYATYPYASFCHYKGRIALTTSLFFGICGCAIVYFYDGLGIRLSNMIGSRLLLIADAALASLFILDAVISARRYLYNKKRGGANTTIGLEARQRGDFNALCAEILRNPKYLECKGFIQHGNVTVFTHSLFVAKLSYAIALFFNIEDRRSLVRAALLHDFFLYDWHTPEKMWSLHGWTHPVTAAKNALTFFDVSEKEYSLIRTHMWPWTPLHPPLYKEGWIICVSDKIVSLAETLRIIRQKDT
jgi:uncharacterized protein